MKRTRRTGPRWNPDDELRKVLEAILSERNQSDKVETLLDIYRQFRRADVGDIYNIPLDILPSEVWIKELFEVGEGESKRLRLDPIADDFLLLLGCTQRLTEVFYEIPDGGALIDYLINRRGNPNLSNSLIRIEALSNFLRLEGFQMDESGTEDSSFVLFTDPPERILTDEESDNPLRMVRDTEKFSRMVRGLSVRLQEGGGFQELQELTSEKFGLPPMMRSLDDKRNGDTFSQAQWISLDREFRLWDRFRGMKFPSLRMISDDKGIPYQLLLMINSLNIATDYYKGTDLLNGISQRTILNIYKEIITQAERIRDDLKLKISTIEKIYERAKRKKNS